MEAPAAVEGAGAVIEAAATISDLMPTYRQCGIEIENECTIYTFDNPRIYTDSGYCDTPLPPTVAPGASGKALFIKTPDTATGCVGVVTYDLLNKDENQAAGKIAVMFSVPYDFGLYNNWYALGVFDMSTKCDYGLYQKMYYDKQTTFSRQTADGSSLTYEGGNITIKGTMSDAYQSVIKVQVSQN
ncbi:DELTA-sagatoxin-Srs1a-like [Gymnodraco acuticeps]|uniref:DELTA-sagatoxin-Srs1a-like n=1 Tax=Gymnodraco acuticeps TaxID=8218 RepID=A0A6P8TI67_GYMAC|nr:DELTA-sagatoxin-Srs1a-like [Gymnodraco acuticeps]XP_034063704.1 DELTA-sagatoxin-Srs1a-like [Gymnodraco acuticeps]XP_034063711.1 DELTA-sagatoxin-Srs1a-like [Gymnodraco acuticeps]XP_034063720.1 DELTA-sagatoxin-Srs1a-like [Gymnodraco acuticeps]